MWGPRQRQNAVAIVVLLVLAGIPAAVEGASSNPATDYAESDILLVDTTWHGDVLLTRGVVVPAGRTLTIENATVKFNTTNLRHFGLNIDPLGKIVVRDSLLTINHTFANERSNAEAYWDFFSKGIIDIQRSTIRYAGDISLEQDFVRGSIIRDSDLLWLARGIHVLRTNLTNADGFDLTLENVLIQDMPVVAGAGTPDIGGAIGILNGDVSIRNVTIERARTTGLFVDRSAVSDDTELFGNRVEARDLTIIGGSPPGMTGQGALLYVRTTGSFLCEQCALISPIPGGQSLLSDATSITMRETTLVDTTLNIKLPATTQVAFDGLAFDGPTSGIRYLYANAAHPTFSRVSFTPGSEGGVFAEKLLAQDLRGVWWGDASGPRDIDDTDGSTPSANPGTGRPITGSIDYSGWATSAPARDGLRVTIGALPSAATPGASVSAPFTVANAGSAPVDVALHAVGLTAPALSLASASLAPGATASGILTFSVPATAAPGSTLGAAIVASAPGQRAAAHAATMVGSTTPRLTISSPLMYAETEGAIQVAGTVIEPTSGTTSSAMGFVGGPPDANGDAVDDRAQLAPGLTPVLIRYHSSTDVGLREAIESVGGHVVRAFSLAPIVWAYVPSAELPGLAARTDVRDIWWDEPAQEQLAYAARTARARTSQEGVLPNGVAPDADYAGVWRGNPSEGYQGITGRGSLIAIIDTGIDPTHASTDDMDDDITTVDPKIAARISTFTILATEGADVALSSVVSPGQHGTWVAGTAAGTGAKFTGPQSAPLHGSTADDPWMRAGIAPGARIVDIDAFEDTADVSSKIPPVGFGLGTLAPDAGFGLVLEGFEAVAAWNRQNPDDPIKIVQISLALGSTEIDHPVNDLANALADTGVLIVVAVGNNHPGAVVPATAQKVLAVGATKMFETVSRLDDGKAAFSDVSNAVQIGAGVRKPELMAPGSVVWMPKFQSLDDYNSAEGTSFAAPVVSGVAALVLEANPDLHPAQVKEILLRSSEPRGGAAGQRYTDIDLDFEDDLADGGWDPQWGYGYVDAEEAVRLARETLSRAPPAPPTLTLYASGPRLSKDVPTQSVVQFGHAEWDYATEEALSVGDGDPATDETALLVLSAPVASLGPSTHTATASLYRDDTLVSRFLLIDDRVTISTTQDPIRLPMPLGRTAQMVLRGPDTGQVEMTGDLGVLDDTGTLQVALGQTLRLVVDMNESGGVPLPIVASPGGTMITLDLDPRTLPNGGPPSAVPGTSADWNASSVSLHWGPAADDRGIGEYRVFRDGDLLATVSGAKHEYLDPVGPGEEHRYRVRAIDLHGLAGPLGPEVLVTTPLATGRSVIVDVAGTSARADDLALDGTLATWSATLTPLRVGRQALRATLFSEGEPVSTQSLAVNIKSAANAPPSLSLTGPLGLLHGARAFTLLTDDPNGADDIRAREWRVDEGAWHPIAEDVLTLDARAMPAGAHTLEARAIDASGSQALASLGLDSEPWTATIDAPDIVAEGTPALVRVALAGIGSDTAAPRLVGEGAASFDLPMSTDGVAWTALLPALPSGLLRLSVRDGDDSLGERALIVDKPAHALILAPRTSGTRLDTLTLIDASTDDGGIAERTWTLPDGTTSHDAILAFPLANVPVGASSITLNVANVNGLLSSASLDIDVTDLAPVITASPFRLNGAPVSVAYTGETIALTVGVADPENDALDVAGGLAVDGVLSRVGAGATSLSARPLVPGALSLDVTAADPWKSATLSRSIEVKQNQPPIASLIAPANANAFSTYYLDSRGSRDPDRALVSRQVVAPGVGAWSSDRALVAFPLGAWDVTLTVTDTSGEATSVTKHVVADDWISAHVTMDSPASALDEGDALVAVKWYDGAPVADAEVEMLVSHGYLGFSRSVSGTTDAEGRVHLAPGTDLSGLNLPGPHDLEVVIRHASRPGAPTQDIEEALATLRYQV